MVKVREIKRRYELEGPEKTIAHFSEMLAKRRVRPEDFSIRALAEGLVPDGREWLNSLDPRRGGFVQEAGDGVDVTAFSNITGQIIYTKIMEAYQREEFVVSRLVSTIPTRFDGEKIAGIAGIVDDISEIRPGMPYPSLGFGEDYIETPSTTKRGFIVPVTKEAIFFDRTYQVLSRASEVGEILGLNKEKRLLDIVIGVTNNYNWKGTTLQHLSNGDPLDQHAGRERIGRLDQRRQRRTVVRQYSRSEHGRAGAGHRQPGAGLPAIPCRGPAGVQRLADRLHDAGSPTRTRVDADLLLRQPTYQVEESRLMYRRLLAAGVAIRKRSGSWAISRRRLPTWRTGRSR